MSSGAIGLAAEPLARRLAAVVSLDVVGYSRMTSLDELGTHERWRRLAAEIVRPAVTSHRGEIVKGTGDGFLIEFRSAVEAVRCAVAIQDGVTAASLGGAHAVPIVLRAAVHLGEIIADEGDIYGNGVNIACHLQAAAQPGEVVVSAVVHEQVRHAIAYEPRDLGWLTLKDINPPVRAYAVRQGALPTSPGVRRPASPPSIAVLPFRSMAQSGEEPYFAEGVVHDIVGSLSALRELLVVSSGPTSGLPPQTSDLGEIGRRLDARYIVSGSLWRTGGRLLLSVLLSDTEQRCVLWSERFEIDEGDLFKVQDQIATRITYSLAPHVRQSEMQRALRKPPESIGAYDLVLQAWYRVYRVQEGDLEAALELLRRALELDPHYGMAHALTAMAHMQRFGVGTGGDVEMIAREVLRHASLAIEADNANPIAYAIYGHAKSYLFGAYDEAIQAFDRALACSPNSPVAWGFSSPTYAYLGDGASAISRGEYALRLSPLDPHAYWHQATLTLAHYVSNSFEEAVRWGRRTLAANPRFTANHRSLMAAHVALGQLDEARALAAAMLAIEPQFRVEAFIRRYPIRDGRARALLAERLVAAGLPA